MCLAQTPHGNRPPKGAAKGVDKPELVPLFALRKSAGFKLEELPSSGYNLMASQKSILLPGFGGKLKKKQPIVVLTYGSKTGGVLRVYETPRLVGFTPESFVRTVAKTGQIHDVSRDPKWVVIGKIMHGVFVVPTSADGRLVRRALTELAPNGR